MHKEHFVIACLGPAACPFLCTSYSGSPHTIHTLLWTLILQSAPSMFVFLSAECSWSLSSCLQCYKSCLYCRAVLAYRNTLHLPGRRLNPRPPRFARSTLCQVWARGRDQRVTFHRYHFTSWLFVWGGMRGLRRPTAPRPRSALSSVHLIPSLYIAEGVAGDSGCESGREQKQGGQWQWSQVCPVWAGGWRCSTEPCGTLIIGDVGDVGTATKMRGSQAPNRWWRSNRPQSCKWWSANQEPRIT